MGEKVDKKVEKVEKSGKIATQKIELNSNLMFFGITKGAPNTVQLIWAAKSVWDQNIWGKCGKLNLLAKKNVQI